MERLVKLYNDSKPILEWAGGNEPDPNLIYKSGVCNQAKKVMAVADLLRLDPPRVISTHTSKSVGLPPVKIPTLNASYFVMEGALI